MRKWTATLETAKSSAVGFRALIGGDQRTRRWLRDIFDEAFPRSSGYIHTLCSEGAGRTRDVWRPSCLHAGVCEWSGGALWCQSPRCNFWRCMRFRCMEKIGYVYLIGNGRYDMQCLAVSMAWLCRSLRSRIVAVRQKCREGWTKYVMHRNMFVVKPQFLHIWKLKVYMTSDWQMHEWKREVVNNKS